MHRADVLIWAWLLTISLAVLQPVLIHGVFPRVIEDRPWLPKDWQRNRVGFAACPRPGHPLRLRGAASSGDEKVLDSTDEICRCLMGCRCSHCWRRRQGDKIDRNILPTFPIDTMADAGNAPPDTLPSWPPPVGSDVDVCMVGDPNSTDLEYALFGPPDAEELRLLRERAELRAAEGIGADEANEVYFAGAPIQEYSNESTAVYGKLDVPETRRVVMDAGVWTWEQDNPDETRVGNWYKITGRRALHLEGQSRWETKGGDGGSEGGSGRGRGIGVEAEPCRRDGGDKGPADDWCDGKSQADKEGWVMCDAAVQSRSEQLERPGRDRVVKVLDTVLRGGWFLTDETAGSMLHVVCHKDRGGALMVLAGGNWTFVESRFRVRPGPLRAGNYPEADRSRPA